MPWHTGVPMKKPFCLTILFLVIAALPLVSYGASGPRMLIEGKEFNFKEIEEGKVITHTFKVSNKGGQPLEIKRVSPG